MVSFPYGCKATRVPHERRQRNLCNRRWDLRLSACGQILPGTDVSTADDNQHPTRDGEMTQATYDDFGKLDIRVGRIVQVDEFPKARRPAWKLRIDFGSLGIKSSSAQIVKHYDPPDLIGRLVIAIVNLPPRQIADFDSEVLTLGAILNDRDLVDIVLVQPDRDVPLGTPIR